MTGFATPGDIGTLTEEVIFVISFFSGCLTASQMQALSTSDYRGGFQWPHSHEDEEDSYPLYVPR